MRSMLIVVFVGATFVYFHLPATAQTQTVCNVSALKGRFAFAGSGFVPVTQQGGAVRFDPIGQIGIVTYDGAGGGILRTTAQYQGKSSDVVDFKGSYSVQNDCEGNIKFMGTDGTVYFRWDFVIVHAASEVETLALSAPAAGRAAYFMTFSQKKQQ